MATQVAFFIMTRKGYLSLKRFLEEFEASYIYYVVAAQDPNIEEDFYATIKQLCNLKGVRFFDRNDSYILRNDVICFAISWRWLINASNGNIIVFHDSLLPCFRGFSPLVTSLIKGNNITGVTALIANDDFDRGEILLQKSCAIEYPIKISNAIELIAEIYCDLIIELSRKIFSEKKLISIPQDDSLATYSLWLDEKDYSINWALDSITIKRFIDSVGYPYKGASSLLAGRKIRIFDAEIDEDVIVENRMVGKVLFVKDGVPSVVCGKGILKIRILVDDETKISLLPLTKYRCRFE